MFLQSTLPWLMHSMYEFAENLMTKLQVGDSWGKGDRRHLGKVSDTSILPSTSPQSDCLSIQTKTKGILTFSPVSQLDKLFLA